MATKAELEKKVKDLEAQVNNLTKKIEKVKKESVKLKVDLKKSSELNTSLEEQFTYLNEELALKSSKTSERMVELNPHNVLAGRHIFITPYLQNEDLQFVANPEGGEFKLVRVK